MSTGSRPAVGLSRGKKIWFSATAVLLTLAVIELICRCTILFLEHASNFEMRSTLEMIASGSVRQDNTGESIHPYFGWVMNPQVNPGTDLFGRHIPVNSLGFNDEEHGIPKRRTDKLIVGVTGGSVAWQMSVAGEKLLIQKLRQSPLFRDRDIQLIRLAMSGYKQPQQLMALNFVLALGGEFDVIVNIDGYNEMALAVCENDASGVFGAYPRMWHARVHDIVDPRVYSLSFRLLQLRATRPKLAADLLQSRLRWSAVSNLIWYVRDRSFEQELVDLGDELRTHKRDEGLGFAALGPPQLYQGKGGVDDYAALLWKNCSQQMYRLCRGNGTAFVHILQPNQYFPESKPMGRVEKKAAWVDGQCYGMSIARGYPKLISEGKDLLQEGIAFYDLTMLFSKIDDPIYVDPFCHYNLRGNELLAEAVAEKIIDTLRPLPP